ncbi:MAG: hypothetical protein FJX42_03630 [Alphaproteobacteria bacterium]|nr:hypothetical protein [Alphaproteobacteria bacterium]
MGREVARPLRAFGAHVVAFGPARPVLDLSAEAFRWDDAEGILRQASIVSLHCPPSANGKPLLGANEIGLLKQGSVIVNAARISPIDEAAMIAALDRGQVGIYATDVLAEEPPRSLALAGHARAIGIGHIGALTWESIDRAVQVAVSNLFDVLVPGPDDGLPGHRTAFCRIADRTPCRPTGAGVSLYWLGQAGFAIRSPDARIVIDPYLSDSLAVKHRSKAYPHRRTMPAPVTPAALGPVDRVLCTHQHTDHMDSETLKPLAEESARCLFVIPTASPEDIDRCVGNSNPGLRIVRARTQTEYNIVHSS